MKFFLAYIIPLFVMFGISCESNRTFEQYVSLKNDEWNLSQKPVFYVDVNDTITEHNIYFNIRHTGNYKYANLFILFTVQGPKSKAETNRFEFKLAEADGKWLGSGLGDVYSSSIPVMQKIKFPKKGVYSFSIEQNMRDNPLLGIEDVGVRIEKANQ
jgi:gliding motility-associated lipoprotein GldH